MTDEVIEANEFTPPARSSKAAARHARRAEREAKRNPQSGAKPLRAKTLRQQHYIDALKAGESVIAVGGAGTGKTYIGARMAAKRLLAGEIEKIIVSRVTVSKPKHANGFLPGKLEQKQAPWMIPVIDGLRAEVSGQQLDQWRDMGKFEIAPFETMRGRTFANAFVILDEAQNADRGDLKMFMTRIGENSQVVVTGDGDQIDIPNSGLEELVRIVEEDDLPIHVIAFTDDDIVRSEFAKAFVKAYAKRSVKQNDVGNLDTSMPFLHSPRRVTNST